MEYNLENRTLCFGKNILKLLIQMKTNSINQVAEKIELSLQRANAVQIDNKNYASELLTAVFEAPLPSIQKPVNQLVVTKEGYTVFSLTDVQLAKVDLTSDQLKQYEQFLTQVMGLTEYQNYIKAL